VSKNKYKVAVLMGGIGEERAVSLESGRCVAEALTKAGVETIKADINPDNLSILDVRISTFFLSPCMGISAKTANCSRYWKTKGSFIPEAPPRQADYALTNGSAKSL